MPSDRSRSRDGHSRSRRSRSRDRRSRSRDQRRREQSTRDERPSTSSHHKKKKSKSHRRRSSSSSSASSSQSNGSHNSMKLLKVLEDRRVEEHLERKRLKQEMKANETLEQKRARRLAEKQAKEQRRRQRMGWDTEYQHYTNDDNPFGDSTLTSTFVWGKKLEKDGLRGVPLETVEVLSRQKQLENKLELEKVKKRRMERELERQARDEEMTLMQRSKEAAQFQEWERQEDQFHLEQARLRSIIRIQDGRAKPIDLLAQYISSENLDEIEMQMHEPYLLLNGLEIKDLEDLLVDIKVYIELEKGNNSDFWDDMTVIVEDELHKLRKIEAENERTAATGRREGIHQNVAKDVSEIFRGKSTKELDELRERIESKIAARSDGVDISYWETLRYQLKAHMARSRLRDRHRASLRQKLSILRKAPDEMGEGAADSGEFGSQIKKEHDSEAAEGGPEGAGGFDDFDDCFRQYDEGSYSPEYLTVAQVDSAVITAEQDEDRFNAIRSQILERLHADKTMSREEAMMRSEARKGMAGDEAEFSVETPLDTPIQLASDKYRPRKPRYFNRVHTGFEWNKYNQTHYDMDNPPPKIVQGYKFNIFYPDLIDKSVTPQYFLTACKDNGDFAILRFHAGPPYEDIAFKVVNREWEFSYKRGFRCQFQNNVFQLWFHFKRYRYRR